MVGFTISTFDREIGVTAAEGKKLRKAFSDHFDVTRNNLEGSLRSVENESSILATAKEEDQTKYTKILKELRKYASYMRQQAKKKTGSAASPPPVDTTSSNTSADPAEERSLASEEREDTKPQLPPLAESSKAAAQPQALQLTSKRKLPGDFKHDASAKAPFPQLSGPSIESGTIGLRFGRRVPFGEKSVNTLVVGMKGQKTDKEANKEAERPARGVREQNNDTEVKQQAHKAASKKAHEESIEEASKEAGIAGGHIDRAQELSSKPTAKRQNKEEQHAGASTRDGGGSGSGSGIASTRRPSSFLANVLALQRGKGF